MPVVPTRFAVEFGEVFPFGAFVLGVEPSMAFSADANAPKQQERDKETGQLVWVVRALDANEDAARFGAEFKVKITADHQPVPPEKLPGFPFPPVEFDGLTITPYANNKGRIAHSFRAKGMQAPGGTARKPAPAREPKAA
ncbi:plasmid replication, integration and excision activator [Actinophytocola sp. NPDC049390]|uniref:plasmid replication, integration and excision activator n=1 Tax=Actinophytocola sp. NPDC049390 TaxID=3363894 RepID=UPI003792A447